MPCSHLWARPRFVPAHPTKPLYVAGRPKRETRNSSVKYRRNHRRSFTLTAHGSYLLFLTCDDLMMVEAAVLVPILPSRKPRHQHFHFGTTPPRGEKAHNVPRAKRAARFGICMDTNYTTILGMVVGRYWEKERSNFIMAAARTSTSSVCAPPDNSVCGRISSFRIAKTAF